MNLAGSLYHELSNHLCYEILDIWNDSESQGFSAMQAAYWLTMRHGKGTLTRGTDNTLSQHLGSTQDPLKLAYNNSG